MIQLVRFKWKMRGKGVRKKSCTIEPIKIAGAITAKHCGDYTSDCCNGVAISELPLAYDEQNSTLRKDGTVGTLTTDGSSPKHNNRVIVGNNQVRIRRLTPREVWRLQGFPDEYFDKAAAVISDTQLYKAAGNAVSVPVAKAIGLRLKEIEQCEDINNLMTTD